MRSEVLIALLGSVVCVSAAVHRARRDTDNQPPAEEGVLSDTVPPSIPPTAPPAPPPSSMDESNFSIGNVIYSIVGALLAGTLMFLILYDPIRKSFIHLLDTAFGTETGTRKRRDALDSGLAATVAEAFDTFTGMQDKMAAMQQLVNQ